MLLTNVLKAKAKSKHIMVALESIVTGHQIIRIRERLADKLEFIYFDPFDKSLKVVNKFFDKLLLEALLMSKNSKYKEKIFNAKLSTEKQKKYVA